MHFTEKLHRRERQILEAVYKLGSASVNDVLAELPIRPPTPQSAPSCASSKRMATSPTLRREPKYIYHPTKPRPPVAREALYKLMETFSEDARTDREHPPHRRGA